VVEVDAKEDLAGLIYTGGTTGLSKGAMLTHHNLLSNVTQGRAWFPGMKEGEEGIMCVLPFFHSFGMTVAMNIGIRLAAKLILEVRFDLKTTLASVQREKPTMFPGVPRLYIAINEAKETSDYDLKSIKACFSGAAPLPIAVQKKFEQLTGGKIVGGMGSPRRRPSQRPSPSMAPGRPGPSACPSLTPMFGSWTWTIGPNRCPRARRESSSSAVRRSCRGTSTARTRRTR
jgi:long-chain acyl-CoA synthetase